MIKLSERDKRSITISLVDSTIIFGVLSVTQTVLMNVLKLMERSGKLFRIVEEEEQQTRKPTFMFSRSAAVSVFVGTVVADLILEVPMKVYKDYMTAIDRMADGDFSVRINTDSLVFKLKPMKNMADKFNHLAATLEHNEVFKTDFINNFSHEFKTPIVSISGFTKLLKKGNLTDEEKMEYLDIIDRESARLTAMATNVLNMTKLDNQTMLTEITNYNVSEQIRTAFLMLEKKWETRDIDFNLDFDEVYIDANEELMQEVWINLLDNAIKFTPDGGFIEVTIMENENEVVITIVNSGSEIKRENLFQVFEKFYQEDLSHSIEGNGLGLAIVNKIVSLHHGQVRANSHDNLTAFQVTLPTYK